MVWFSVFLLGSDLDIYFHLAYNNCRVVIVIQRKQRSQRRLQRSFPLLIWFIVLIVTVNSNRPLTKKIDVFKRELPLCMLLMNEGVALSILHFVSCLTVLVFNEMVSLCSD